MSWWLAIEGIGGVVAILSIANHHDMTPQTPYNIYIYIYLYNIGDFEDAEKEWYSYII